ncbi:hypothetical protein BCR33DRAFT_716504 [Rhizoclosmatium globosum]|uniref:G-protein coupled receptors family 3 profile domain-containing protein n=1 Tax=Rhizoclosmatium globosum TaxID=329046 RepID=A0A1Y2CDP2_9FUNG|nr:hypothetical protein BCR33DRAFT_716504 [Rhizoclosmatium globosum]|eukprot:ORY45181.1 hypothetical protein BCR33DRAFT_716504 [Rhizoclosmatium globosum]
MLWCMKDAIKYGYITFRSMTICGYSPRKISRFSYASASVSIVLYCILMAQVYSFNVQTNCSAYFQSNIPRVSLYLFWTVIDVASAVSIIFKMRKAILETQENLGYSVDSIAFSIVKFREELRLIFVGVSMLPVMIVIIVQTTHPELPTYRVGTMVFIFAQLILVIGSKKVVVQTPSDPDYTDIEKKACTAKKFSDPRLSIEKGQSQSTLDICE